MWQNAGDSDKGIAEVLKFSPATPSALPKMEATRQWNLSRLETQKLQDRGLFNVLTKTTETLPSYGCA